MKFIQTANLPGTLATNSNYLVYFEFGTLRIESDFDSFIATSGETSSPPSCESPVCAFELVAFVFPRPAG